MSSIRFQPFPHVPPIGFFQPISADPEDMMSDVEFLLGVVKKLNIVIKQVNSNTAFIEEYSGKIEEIEAELADLKNEMRDFEEDVREYIYSEFARIRVELSSLIATALTQANAYTDSKVALLEDEIAQIIVGQITVYDPTTGILSPLQTVINNLYDSGRVDALTASEYDALDLSATDYDAYQLTAYDYDTSGKTLLV